jgi:UDP-glucose 4-epimerase
MIKRAVLIGGSGFLGRWLGRALSLRGLDLVVVSRRQPLEDWGEWVQADAAAPEAVAETIRPGDLVVHLVHSTIPAESGDDLHREERENVQPYAALLDAAAPRRPGLWVYFSSGGQVYGEQETIPIPETALPRPVTAYGRAKLAMEETTRQAAARAGFPWLILRPGNPYGPCQELTNRHGAVPALLRAARRGIAFALYGGGITVRDYVFVEEAAEAAARLMLGGTRDRAVNIGSGVGTSLRELVALTETVTGARVRIEDRPLRPSDARVNVLDVSLLQSLVGGKPRLPLRDGLRLTWKYLKAHETP